MEAMYKITWRKTVVLIGLAVLAFVVQWSGFGSGLLKALLLGDSGPVSVPWSASADPSDPARGQAACGHSIRAPGDPCWDGPRSSTRGTEIASSDSAKGPIGPPIGKDADDVSGGKTDGSEPQGNSTSHSGNGSDYAGGKGSAQSGNGGSGGLGALGAAGLGGPAAASHSSQPNGAASVDQTPAANGGNSTASNGGGTPREVPRASVTASSAGGPRGDNPSVPPGGGTASGDHTAGSAPVGPTAAGDSARFVPEASASTAMDPVGSSMKGSTGDSTQGVPGSNPIFLSFSDPGTGGTRAPDVDPPQITRPSGEPESQRSLGSDLGSAGIGLPLPDGSVSLDEDGGSQADSSGKEPIERTVPEPSVLLMFGVGLAGACLRRLRVGLAYRMNSSRVEKR